MSPGAHTHQGARLRGPSLRAGEEVDAVWAAPAGGFPGGSLDVPLDTIPYGASYDALPGETYEARLRVIPVACTLQLLLLFVTAEGRIVHSPRADAVPEGMCEGVARRWRTVTVRAVAPPSARFTTILVRMINSGPEPRCPSAFMTDAILGRAAPDPVAAHAV